MGEPGAGEDLFISETVAFHVRVPAPEPAVKAVLLADIAKFDQPPQVDIIVQMVQFHRQPPPEKALHLLPLRRQQDLDIFPVQIRFAEYVVERSINWPRLSP